MELDHRRSVPTAAAATRPAWLGYAAVWLAALAYLAGGAATFAAMALFLVGVGLPCWLLLLRALRRAIDHEGLARLVAAAAALVLVTPLYVLRKAVPLPPALADSVLVALMWGLAWRTRALRGAGAPLRALAASPARAYVGVVLPVVFCAAWLGFGVRTPASVDFLGLFFIDFGNLVSMVNLLRASPLLPLSPIAQSGALGYHWLYFAFPAWATDFLGLHGNSAHALVIADLLTASLLYWTLVRSCTRALEAARLSVDPARLAPHLAGVALFALSTLYAYQAAVGALHQSWLSLGTRNHLLLQLPHSMICFGHNTVGLILALLTCELLARWGASGRRMDLALAAGLTALLPGYGILLVFPVALAVAGWAIGGRDRRPVLTLVAFGGFAAAGLVVFRLIGLISYGNGGHGGIAAAFDHGQFVQNVLLGFFPVTAALALCAWKVRDRALVTSLAPQLWLLLACLVVPTFLMTQGLATSAIDFSMKTASLYLAAAVPFFAVAAAWLLTRWPAERALGVAGAALVLLGLGNAAGYVFQYALHRARGHGSVVYSITLDHHRALELVAREPARLILLDELSMPSGDADPGVMLGGKRTLVATAYEEPLFAQSDAAKESKAAWLAWQRRGFDDEAIAAQLADQADLLIAASSVRSPSWSLVASFGNVTVYRSTRRRS